MFYTLRLLYNMLIVVIPMGLQAGVWSVQTVLKLIVLFFALIILLIGPKIGMPAVIYQQTWSLLIRMGCVNASSIVRVARQAGAAGADDENADVTVIGRELVRAGMANMSLTLATTVIQDSVEGVVSEIFWAVVDVVGLGCYFRNVARYKQRYDEGLPAREHATAEPEEEDEEVYAEDESGQGHWNERHIRRVNGDEDEDSSAATLALVIHKTQKGVSSIWAATARWWKRRRHYPNPTPYTLHPRP